MVGEGSTRHRKNPCDRSAQPPPLRMTISLRSACTFLLATAACGSVEQLDPDAGPELDAGEVDPDAGVDPGPDADAGEPCELDVDDTAVATLVTTADDFMSIWVNGALVDDTWHD